MAQSVVREAEREDMSQKDMSQEDTTREETAQKDEAPRRAVKKYSLMGEFFLFLKHEKKWWLGPFIGILLVLGLVLTLTQGSVVAPFIYTLF